MPVIMSWSERRFHVGPLGSGARLKLVVNLVLGLNRAVLAEGLALAGACGIDAAAALEVLKQYAGVFLGHGDQRSQNDRPRLRAAGPPRAAPERRPPHPPARLPPFFNNAAHRLRTSWCCKRPLTWVMPTLDNSAVIRGLRASLDSPPPGLTQTARRYNT